MQKNYIICAIDFCDIESAYTLSQPLKGKVAAIKLGLEFFTACGIDGIRKIAELGIPIFLDLKLHDIPNTVAKTAGILRDLNLFMLTIHISGGTNMIQATIDELHGNTKIMGVTMLTSLADDDLSQLGFDNKMIGEHVSDLARLGQRSGIDGVICSGYEVFNIKRICGRDFITVVPGIRLSEQNHDQKRTMTPGEAIKLGADYLVIGRAITDDSDPLGAINKINDNIDHHIFK